MKRFQFGLDTCAGVSAGRCWTAAQGEYAEALERVRRQERAARRRREDAPPPSLNQEFRRAAAAGITIADAMG